MNKVTAKLARDRMERAREDTAGQVLAWEKVMAAIGDAAGKGLGLVLLSPPAGVSIRATKPAAELVEKLTAAGFRIEWRERRDAHDVPNHDLAISWEVGAIG